MVGVWFVAPLQRSGGAVGLVGIAKKLAEQLGLICVISAAISVASWDQRRRLEKAANKT